MNATEQRANHSFEASSGIEAFHRNLDRLLNLDRSKATSWPKSLLRFQNQLIKIGLNVGVDESWGEVLDLEDVDSPHHVSESVTNGLRADNFSRFEKASFWPKRRRAVVDDPEHIDHFDAFLEKKCPLGIRSRDSRRVPGREEPQRIRIVTEPWNTVFSHYNEERQQEGMTPISLAALRLICRNHLPHYRRSNPRDRQYALCTECAQLDSLMEVVNKNSLFDQWNVTKEEILRQSVCDVDKYDCIWGNCSNCDEDSTLEKLIKSIPNYNDIIHGDVDYAMLMKYEVGDKKTTTSVWVNQTATVEEFLIDLNNSLFTSSSKSTGKKVSFPIF